MHSCQVKELQVNFLCSQEFQLHSRVHSKAKRVQWKSKKVSLAVDLQKTSSNSRTQLLRPLDSAMFCKSRSEPISTRRLPRQKIDAQPWLETSGLKWWKMLWIFWWQSWRMSLEYLPMSTTASSSSSCSTKAKHSSSWIWRKRMNLSIKRRSYHSACSRHASRPASLLIMQVRSSFTIASFRKSKN